MLSVWMIWLSLNITWRRKPRGPRIACNVINEYIEVFQVELGLKRGERLHACKVGRLLSRVGSLVDSNV